MYLLDTHTFLWYLSGDSALPRKIIETISKTEHVYLSVASLWEIAIKQSVNKLKYSDSIVDLGEICKELHFEILDLDLPSIERVKKLPFLHKDPFDRILIAQAQENSRTIITKDMYIPKYDVSALQFE